MKFNRIISIAAAIVLIASAVMIPGVAQLSAQAISQDEMLVDFNSYTVKTDADTATENNTQKFNPSLGINETYWSVQEENDGNKYMQFKKPKDSSKTGWVQAYTFICNPTGGATESTSFLIEKGGKYKITFNYKMSIDDNNGTSWRSVGIRFYTSDDYRLGNTIKQIKSTTNLPAVNKWTQMEIEIPATGTNAVTGKGAFCMNIAPNSSNSPSDKFAFTVAIDDVKVEKIYDYWNGKVATSFAGGTGTMNDPYQIANGNQLAYLAKIVNENTATDTTLNPTYGKYYALTSDIDLNDVKIQNWQNNNPNKWFCSTDLAQSFCGTLNGQGHKISGIYIDKANEAGSYGGLFGILGKGAEIKNLAVVNSYISASNAGGIAGLVQGDTKIRRSYTAKTTVNGNISGGFIGTATELTEFDNCYTTATVISVEANGAAAFVANSTAKVKINGGWADVGDIPIIGSALSTDISAIYSTATVDQNSVTKINSYDLVGTEAKNKLNALDFTNIWVAQTALAPQLYWQVYGYSPDIDFNDDLIEGVWSGKIAKKYHGGSGTKDDPYQISNAEELALLSNTVKSGTWNNYPTKGKYYELINDIVVNDTTEANWRDTAKSWIYGVGNVGSSSFNGVLNGNGHTINGLYINATEANSVGGLFISIGDGAVIKNLGLENSYIAAQNAGGFAGTVENREQTDVPQIIACYGGANVLVKSLNDDGFAGGILSHSSRPVVLRYCYFIGSVEASEKKVGGLVGASWDYEGHIKYRSCYSATANEKNIVGGVSAATKATNTYATFNKIGTKVILSEVELMTVERMTGAAAIENMKNFDFEQVWIPVSDSTPRLRVFEKGYDGIDPQDVIDPFERQINDDTEAGDIWTGCLASKFNGGDGSESNPYQIATGEQLAYFVQIINDSVWDKYATKDKYYILTADIYLNDVSDKNWYEKDGNEEWLAGSNQSQAFCGNLNGDGHIIYGLYFNKDNAGYCALITSLGKNAVIRNLGIASSYIYNGGNYASAFAAYVENRPYPTGVPVITNCFVAEDVYITSSNQAGGLVAGLPTTIEIDNCYFLGQLDGERTRTGAFIGYSWYNGIYKDENEEILYSKISDSFICNELKNLPIGSLSYNFVNGENTYSIVSQSGISTSVSFSNMTDEKAKTYLKGLDFENVWQIVSKSTPVLKIFADRDEIDISKISRLKGNVKVSFETYGGNEIAAMEGESGAKLNLPTPVRGQDVFDGWYVYDLETWDVPYPVNYFPDDDITLYAKWIETGITQNFEKYPYTESGVDGIDEDFELYRPGSIGYTGDYIHNGMYSLHRLGSVEGYQNATFYTDTMKKLTPGTEYELTMYVYVKGEASADDSLMIAYPEYADWAFDELATEEICKLSSIAKGKWQEITYKFVAYSEYLGIRTPAVEMFIDDVYIISTGRTGLKSLAVKSLPKTVVTTVVIDTDDMNQEITDSDDSTDSAPNKKVVKIYKKRKNNSSFNYVWVIIAASSAVIIAGGVAGIIIYRKKKKI